MLLSLCFDLWLLYLFDLDVVVGFALFLYTFVYVDILVFLRYNLDYVDLLLFV